MTSSSSVYLFGVCPNQQDTDLISTLTIVHQDREERLLLYCTLSFYISFVSEPLQAVKPSVLDYKPKYCDVFQLSVIDSVLIEP